MTRTASIFIAVLTGLAGTGAAGCSFDDPCGFGTCVDDVDGGAPSGTADANSTSSNNNGPGPDRPDSGPSANSGSPDGGSTGPMTDAAMADAGSADSGDNSNPSQCQVDIFSFVCDDDPYEDNDRWSDSEYLGTVGCDRAGQRKAELDLRLDAHVCPLERADYFNVFVATCVGRSTTIEIDFDVMTECSDDAWELDLRAQCDSFPGVSCSRDGDRFIVVHDGTDSPGGVVSVRFGIVTSEDVFLDYDLSVRSY